MPHRRSPAVPMLARLVGCLGLVVIGSVVCAQQPGPDPLAAGLRPFWQAVSSGEPFKLQGVIETPLNGRLQTVDLDLARYSAEVV